MSFFKNVNKLFKNIYCYKHGRNLIGNRSAKNGQEITYMKTAWFNINFGLKLFGTNAIIRKDLYSQITIYSNQKI